MEQLIRRKLLRAGVAFLAGGAILQFAGIAGLVRFAVAYRGDRLETANSEQLVRAAALPHAAIVIGLGFMVFGAVMIFRSRRLHSIRRPLT
jgi:hypothetical protein